MKRSFMFLFTLFIVPALFVMGCGDDKLTPDTTAPLAPILSGASTSEDGLGLWWKPNAEPDLAGYNVYVRENGAIRQTNQGPITDTFFTVDINDEGQIFVYVTAFDFSGNESPFSSTLNLAQQSEQGRVNFPGNPNQQ